MTDQTTPPTCLGCVGCVGCGGPDCIQRTEPTPDDGPQMLVPCSLAVLNWPGHSPHSWKIQPGMDPVRCEGATSSLYARELAAHEEHRRSLALMLDLEPASDWLAVTRGIVEARQLAENMQSRATVMENRATAYGQAWEAAEAALARVRDECAAIERDRGRLDPDGEQFGDGMADAAARIRIALDGGSKQTAPPPDADPCAHGCRQAADELTRLGEEMEQPVSGVLEQATEMDPALAEIERLAIELYQAQDTLAWIGELCDIADRTGRTITTADVRAWLRGPQCARRLVITDGPLVDAVRAARPDGEA